MGEMTNTLNFTADGHGAYRDAETGLRILKLYSPSGWQVWDKGRAVSARARTLRDAVKAAEAYIAERLAKDERRDRDRAEQLAGRTLRIEPTVTVMAERLIEQLRAEIEAAQPQPPKTDPATEDDSNELLDRIVRRAQYEALKVMLAVLAGWVEGARSNCEADGHRGESADYACGQVFDVADIRSMINDTARELGTAEPWTGA